MASTQFGLTASDPGRKIRVVAKIRGFSDPDTNFTSESSTPVDWVSVNRENSGDFTISFKEQSSSRYSVDYCYDALENNEIIYSREVKPLVLAAFEGLNSTVIAHGARGSGKTHLIQGSLERPGLAVLATSEYLSMAEKNGKSVAVSFYEVDHQDHAVDLLNPEQPPILVLEDHGRIQFKGITQTPVKSIAEFQKLYITACSAQKAAPKKGFEHACRSHMGLTVSVFSQNEGVDGLVSKMNFVDMAGYEDTRRRSSDGSGLAENNKINKSIYALLNVCHALSTNESRVPYRESKLTRMLQDSLRGTSKILLVSCLNPSFCQDTIYMVSLASRSCQRIPLDSLKKSSSSARQTVTLDSTKKNAVSARQTVTSDSTKKSANSIRQTVASDSTKKNASSAKLTITLDSTKKNASSAKPTITLDSTKKTANSARQAVTLESTKKSANSIRQTVASDSTKKSASSAKLTVSLDSTKKSANSIRQTVGSDSTKKSASSAKLTVSLDSTKKSASSARQTVASDFTKKSASSARQMVTLDCTKKNASSARQTVASDSTKKSASPALQGIISHKNKIPISVSATTKKLPVSKSHIHEKKGVVAVKSAMKGRKLFEEASHSAAKAEKEIPIAQVTKASEPLLDDSLSEDGNDVHVNSMVEQDSSLTGSGNHIELNSRVEKDHSLANASNNVKLNMVKETEIFIAKVTKASEPLLDDPFLNASSEVKVNPIMEKGIYDDKEYHNEIHAPHAINYSKDLLIADEGYNMNKENNSLMENGDCSPSISSQLRELQSLVSSTPLTLQLPEKRCISLEDQISTEIAEPVTPIIERRDLVNTKSPWETFAMHGSGMKHSLVKDYLRILNTAEKDELKKLKGIGEKRATYILELREESPEPFKSLDDLKDIGLSAKQIKKMMKKEVGELFD
ncbi:kinesin-like protein KIN-10C isoform X3 [Cicer arietinum]|uniref:Kinesin-like protein KIN-10C isoform X2 n=1 Tax=Cicer arietinum TaxID=3827 RepID=A0A1S2YGZ8_CICAR|nr:kinesin-like protein KIN-10C isoform X2 [Cicer arietinum]